MRSISDQGRGVGWLAGSSRPGCQEQLGTVHLLSFRHCFLYFCIWDSFSWETPVPGAAGQAT